MNLKFFFQFNPNLLKCVNRLIIKLNENIDTEINVSDYFKRFTMDTIWNCAFGLDINAQNENSMYLEKSERVFRDAANFNLPMYLGGWLNFFLIRIL